MSASESLDVAVVGHTNVGKTSLLRTLTRDTGFGEVSARPATTRQVEKTTLTVDGRTILALYDTPGLEDSSGLLAHLDDVRQGRGTDWTGAIEAFIADKALQAGFEQEAKVLRQLRASDVAFYVVDARDGIRAKHKDELEILGRTGRPVLPVLNFVASEEADVEAWRAQLARVNMHAVVAFDTVVYDEAGEIALYEKLRVLAEPSAEKIDVLIGELKVRRRQLRRASAEAIADFLVDVAGARATFDVDDTAAGERAAEELKSAVRKREARAVKALFELHRFDSQDYLAGELAIKQGAWEDDPFDPDALARYGISAGKAAATGAAAGLAIDLMVGGMTLGAAALTGATIGVIIDTARKHGRRIAEKLSGVAEVRVADETVMLLALREAQLVRALLRRGHGSVDPVAAPTALEDEDSVRRARAILKALAPARREPSWSRINSRGPSIMQPTRRRDFVRQLAERIEAELIAAASPS